MLLTREFVNDVQRFSRAHKLSLLCSGLLLRLDVAYLIIGYSLLSYWYLERSFFYPIVFTIIFPFWLHLLIVRYCVYVLSPLNFGYIVEARLEALAYPGSPTFRTVVHLTLLHSGARVVASLDPIIGVRGVIGRIYVALVHRDNSAIVLPILDENAALTKVFLTKVDDERRSELTRRIQLLRSASSLFDAG